MGPTFVSQWSLDGPPLGNQHMQEIRQRCHSAARLTNRRRTSSKPVHWNPPHVNVIELA
jgi:hypothetical protein